MSTPSHSPKKLVVVGGGVLATSIVTSMLRAHNFAKPKDIVWIVGTKREAASTDHNKIIRTPYPDKHYEHFAREALTRWEKHESFHKTGWVQAISEGGIRSTRKTSNDTKIELEQYQRMVRSNVSPEILKSEDLWQNPNIGYADTAHALELARQHAQELGIDVIDLDVGRILKNEEGNCIGVEVSAEIPYEVHADRTIVSAGPWIPQLFQASEIPYPKDIVKVVGVVVGILPLNEADVKTLNMDMPISVGEHGEVMISKRHSLLKMTTSRTFEVRSPDDIENHPMARDTTANLAVLRKWFPQFKDRNIESWVCSDLLSVDGRFIIDEAPRTKNLTVASAGSFHSGKFLLNFGELVLHFLERGEPNSLYDELLKGSKWERLKGVSHVHPSVIPQSATK